MVSDLSVDRLDVADLEFIGGRLCLDFANTTSQRDAGTRRERLHQYEDLVRWCVRAELFGPTEAGRLLADAAARPAEAHQALAKALALREAIFSVALAASRGEAPPADDLDRLNAVLSEGMGRRRLRPSPGGLCWAWADEADGLEWMLWPIAYSAAELLSSSEIERVRQCGGESCDWLFVDASRNGSRRWCVMSDCGNRAKARRHYHRSKEPRGSDAGEAAAGGDQPETRVPGLS